MFASIAGRGPSRAETARWLSVMLLAGLSGLFFILLVGWPVAHLYMLPTGLTCSTPWNVSNRKSSTGVMQCLVR